MTSIDSPPPEDVTEGSTTPSPRKVDGHGIAGAVDAAPKKVARFPLAIPGPRPGRLDAYEALLFTRITELIDAVWEIDQTIEEASGLVGELMGDEIRKVGVAWRPHSSRPGEHPTVYRVRGRRIYAPPLADASKDASTGLEGPLPRRIYVEQINPPRGLAWYARAKAADSASEEVRKEQLESLALLQMLLEIRAGAIEALGSGTMRGAAWKREHSPYLGVGGKPPVRGGYRGLVAEIKQRTIDMRLNMEAIRKWNWVKAKQAAALNEADDERRDADKKS